MEINQALLEATVIKHNRMVDELQMTRQRVQQLDEMRLMELGKIRLLQEFLNPPKNQEPNEPAPIVPDPVTDVQPVPADTPVAT